MSETTESGEVAPGESTEQNLTEESGRGVATYLIGFGIASLLTGASFAVVLTDFVWGPAVQAAIVTLAVAQMGVHLVFFLHLTSGPDNSSNAITVAFGTFVCLLVVFGSVWIMTHLSHTGPTHAMPRGM